MPLPPPSLIESMGAPLLSSSAKSRRAPAAKAAPEAPTSDTSHDTTDSPSPPDSKPRRGPSFLARLSKSSRTDRAGSSSSGEGTAETAASSGRSVHLKISPDDESESMQVNIMDGHPSPTKRGDCLYSVGSVDYLVKHGDCAVSDIMQPGGIADVAIGDAEASAGDGNNEKKKGRMSGLFKKGNKDGPEKEPPNNDPGGEGDGNSGDAGDHNEDEKKDDNSPRKQPDGPFDPLAYFGPQRTQFAADCTLPLHTGTEASAPKEHPSWTPVDGTEFKVRRGPNYPKNGKKEASLPSLYEVYCVRYYRSGKRTVGGATRILPLPSMADVKEAARSGEAKEAETGENAEAKEKATTEEAGGDESAKPDAGTDDATNKEGIPHHPEFEGTKVPDVLVVHFMLPYEPPNVFKQRDDGPGGECVYYLRPSQRFLDEMAGRIPMTPATMLFARWCNQCERNADVRARFKCMALVRDIDKHNFGLLKSYNGKPVLITESGRAYSGSHGDVRYLEMTANVHYWAFVAKKGFVSIIPKFKAMQMEVGFTIEAHADSEMPECMLGSTCLSYINEKTGPVISPEMQEPVHEHQS